MSYMFTPDVSYRSRAHGIGDIQYCFRQVENNFRNAIRYLREMGLATEDALPYMRYAHVLYVAPGTTLDCNTYSENDAVFAILCKTDPRVEGYNWRLEAFDNPEQPKVCYVNKEFWNTNTDAVIKVIAYSMQVWYNAWFPNRYVSYNNGLYDTDLIAVDYRPIQEERERQREAERQAELEAMRAEARAKAQQIITDLAETKIRPDYQKLDDDIKRTIRLVNSAMEEYSDAVERMVNALDKNNSSTGDAIGAALLPYLPRITEANLIKDHDDTFKALKFTIDTELSIWNEDEVASALSYLSGCFNDKLVGYFSRLLNGEFTYVSRQSIMITKTGISRAPSPEPNVHPHVGRFDCWGNNLQTWTTAWLAGNYDVAFAIMNNTLAQINLTDYTVMRVFLDYMSTSFSGQGWGGCKCWKYNGQLYTGVEMRGILDADNQTNEEANQ